MAGDGLSDIERLIAIEAIRTLKARRVLALDGKDWETYAALHSDDCVSHASGGAVVGGKALADAVASSLVGVTTAHHVHTPIIQFHSPTQASGTWAMEDNLFWKQNGEKHWLRGFGTYHERYEKRGGEWLFTHRRLERLHVETSPGSWNEAYAVDRSGERTPPKV